MTEPLIKTEIGTPSMSAQLTRPHTVGLSASYLARLRWLMRLRWLALVSVSASSTVAVLGLVPGINRPLVTLAVTLGVVSNAYIQWKISQGPSVDLEGLHVHQALLDTMVLSLVLWACGGSACPFISFYVFPVLLAALLSGRRTFWPTAVASLTGLGWQVLSAHVELLRVGVWNPVPPWDEALSLTAVTITIGMAAYFAARFTDALKAQVLAKRASDELLELTFERLEAGVELVEGGRVVWQNPHASELLGDRVGGAWVCPGAGSAGCSHAAQGCGLESMSSPTRCQFSLGAPHAQASKIYELMLLSPSKHLQRLALYVERTAEVTYQQRLMHTERLASLGRAAQGVAHELNTPLATIQTLSRDLSDALSFGELPQALREDVDESVELIIDEVQRCRRITHALLGRVERGGGGLAPLGHTLSRAVALVFPHQKERVELSLNEHEARSYPSDPITQIFVNLLQNAADATSSLEREGEGGSSNMKESADIKVSASLEQRSPSPTEAERLGLELRVRDHGVGLSPEASQLIFEPFYTTKSKGEGTGLGLYTSYALARELGGALSLSNHPEGGVEAALWLPLS